MATFPKSERIKSKIVLDTVYNEGLLIKSYPFVLKYTEMEFNDKAPVKIVISIPKRIIKKATKRNRIRRQIKEIYRLNKASLIADFETKPKGLALFLIYTGKENEAFEFLETKLKLVLNELQRKI